MAENNSKTFIIGIIIFVVLVIGGFAFFAKKDVSVDQTAEETAITVPSTDAEGAADAVELEPVAAPEAAPTPIPAPADEVTPTAPTPAYDVNAVPAPEAAPAEEPAAEPAPAQ